MDPWETPKIGDLHMTWCFVASDFNWQPLPHSFYPASGMGLVLTPNNQDNMFGCSVILYRKIWKWACQQRVIKN